MCAHVFDVSTLSVNLIIIAYEMTDFNLCCKVVTLLRHLSATVKNTIGMKSGRNLALGYRQSTRVLLTTFQSQVNRRSIFFSELAFHILGGD
jgi:hypothetical protein